MIDIDEKFGKISLKFILLGIIFSQKITLIGQIYILEIIVAQFFKHLANQMAAQLLQGM